MYGGTKEEMERLLADASELAGVDFELSSYADVIEAIHVIQTDIGITGTTAAEAAQTISGSTAAMKAAWQNLLVGISDDTQDFDGLIENLVNSVSTVADNVLPRIEVIFGGLGQLIEQLFPKIVEQIPKLVSEGLPKLVTLATTLLKTLVDGLKKNSKLLASGAVEIITTLIDGIADMLPDIVELGLELIIALAEGIADNISAVLDTVTDVVLRIAEILTTPETLDRLVNAGIDILLALIDGLTKALPQLTRATSQIITALVKAVPDIIDGIVKALLDPKMIDQIVQTGIDIFEALVEDLPTIIAAIVSAVPKIVENLCNHFLSEEFINQMMETGGKLIGALFENFPNIVEGALSIVDGIFGTHLADWYRQVSDFFMEFGSQLYQMQNEDLLNQQELYAKYSTLQADLNAAAVEALRGGATAEEAFEQAKRDVLNTSEKLYAFDVLLGADNFGIDFDIADVERWKSNIEETERREELAQMASTTVQAPQPLSVILQMPSGVEIGRQYIEDINAAKRADGAPY